VVVFIYILFLVGLIFWVEKGGPQTNKYLIMRKDTGAQLEQWLKNFQWGNRQELTAHTIIPRYKYYSEIIEIILDLARKIGGQYQDGLLNLRERLQSDLQFEKKIKEQLWGAVLQMALMVLLTWGFILGALHITQVDIAFFSLSFILLWQVIGLGCLPVALKCLRQKYFADLGKFWRILHILQSLSHVPLARSEILAKAEVNSIKEIKSISLNPLIEKLKDLCRKTLQTGGSYREDLKSLMQDLEFQEKWHFELFVKRLGVLKLMLLGVFFLPAYLAFIFLLLGQLLKVM
jgi:hypothetical protein